MIKSGDDIKQQQLKELVDLIEWIGGRRRLAETLGISTQAVYEMLKRGKISRRGADVIDKESTQFFRREELRPDIKWDEEV